MMGRNADVPARPRRPNARRGTVEQQLPPQHNRDSRKWIAHGTALKENPHTRREHLAALAIIQESLDRP